VLVIHGTDVAQHRVVEVFADNRLLNAWE